MGFFNDLKGTVRDAGKDVSSKARQSTDNARLRNQMKNNDKAIEDLALKIGYRYLEKCGETIDPDYADLVTEVRRLQEENVSLKATLDANTAPAGSKQCPNCGQYNAPEAKFCVNCGTELKAPEPAPEPAAPAPEKFCSACGSANSADAAFCVSCGKPFNSADTAADAPASDAPAADAPADNNTDAQ